jgi:hypothetical protein
MIAVIRAVILLCACLALISQTAADKTDKKPRVRIEFRRAESTPAEGLTEAQVVGKKMKVYCGPTADRSCFSDS